MAWLARLAVLFCHYSWTYSAQTACVIELECAECLPENMPLVTSHRAENGSVLVADGDQVSLWCGAGRLLAYPQQEVAARCEGGRWRVPLDGALRHLLELGCQENVFEDVLHDVEHCAPPLQGRAYQVQQAGGGTLHLATLCYDADRGVARSARVRAGAPPLPPHEHRLAPLSLLGNFNHMFDANTRHAAERLHSDDLRKNRRLRELLRPDQISLAEQTITAARLLSARYFDGQSARAAAFASNAVAAWRSVARGNLAHLQRDVARAARAASLDVFAGTHGVASMRADGSRRALFLEAQRFPVPRYLWTVVVAREARRALAVAVLNDPFVAVSEIRDAELCASACGDVAWLRELRRHRNYETPLYGLAFCCDVHDFAAAVAEMPEAAVAEVPRGSAGFLATIPV